MKLSRGLRQAYDIQDLAYSAMMDLKQGLEAGGSDTDQKLERANAISILTRSWATAQERIRIHKGKPLPGSRRPAPSKPKPSPADGSTGLV